MSEKAVNLSIIIPTCNRGQILEHVLDSILSLTIENHQFELLLIDNASTDNTKEICEQFISAHQNLDVKYLYEPVPGLLSGRHLGAFTAKNEILCFLDDDVVLSPAWAQSVIQIMSNRNDIDLLTGPNLPEYESNPPLWLSFFWKPTPYGGKHCSELSLLDLGDQIIEIDATWVWGLNFVIRKTAFHKLKGFHPDVLPASIQYFQGDGETGLSKKANESGMKSLYHPAVLLHHIVPSGRLTIAYFEKRYYYQGVADSFTQIRLANGMYKQSLPVQSFKSILKKYLKKLKNHFFKGNHQTTISQVSAEEYEMLQNLQKKYNEGFSYHQFHYKTNSLVHEWVLKPDYIDYKLPFD